MTSDFDAPYQQKWFPGVHGSVGGGGSRRGLSDQALEWMLDGARMSGLKLDTHPSSRIYDHRPDYTEYLQNYEHPEFLENGWATDKLMGFLPKVDRKPGPSSINEVDESVIRRWQAKDEQLKDKELYRSPTLSNIKGELDAQKALEVPTYPEGEYVLHEVQRNETLSKIAKRYYKDASKWQNIFAANRYKINNPDKIYIGMILVIPKE